MASTWRDQTGKPDIHKLAFDERFGMLVDAEWLHRENKRLATALRDAKLRITNACMEDIDYSPKRELDKVQVRQLAMCRWVVEHQNVLITGATGTGKTYCYIKTIFELNQRYGWSKFIIMVPSIAIRSSFWKI